VIFLGPRGTNRPVSNNRCRWGCEQRLEKPYQRRAVFYKGPTPSAHNYETVVSGSSSGNARNEKRKKKRRDPKRNNRKGVREAPGASTQGRERRRTMAAAPTNVGDFRAIGKWGRGPRIRGRKPNWAGWLDRLVVMGPARALQVKADRATNIVRMVANIAVNGEIMIRPNDNASSFLAGL